MVGYGARRSLTAALLAVGMATEKPCSRRSKSAQLRADLEARASGVWLDELATEGKPLSHRQRKRQKIARRKRAELLWLGEHPELFVVSGCEVGVELRDYGHALGVCLARQADGRRVAVITRNRRNRKATPRRLAEHVRARLCVAMDWNA